MSNPKDMQGHARYVCPWNLYFPASVTISDSELDLPMKQVGRGMIDYCVLLSIMIRISAKDDDDDGEGGAVFL